MFIIALTSTLSAQSDYYLSVNPFAGITLDECFFSDSDNYTIQP